MSDILDHQRDGIVVTKENGFTGKDSNIHKKTTRSWEVLIVWKDETTTWVYIKDVKEAILINLDEYAVTNQIDDEIAFAWWVP